MLLGERLTPLGPGTGCSGGERRLDWDEADAVRERVAAFVRVLASSSWTALSDWVPRSAFARGVRSWPDAAARSSAPSERVRPSMAAAEALVGELDAAWLLCADEDATAGDDEK